jgi:hypothetical protein
MIWREGVNVTALAHKSAIKKQQESVRPASLRKEKAGLNTGVAK